MKQGFFFFNLFSIRRKFRAKFKKKARPEMEGGIDTVLSPKVLSKHLEVTYITPNNAEQTTHDINCRLLRRRDSTRKRVRLQEMFILVCTIPLEPNKNILENLQKTTPINDNVINS